MSNADLTRLTEDPGGRFDLSRVIANEEFASRPARSPDYAGENRVLLRLAETMRAAPDEVLQQLVDSALELCHADSAGISLLEESSPGTPPQFRWKATAGGFGPFAGNTMPRDFSPCGAVLDANRTLLMQDPVRHYEHIDGLPLAVREVLLVPFCRSGVPVGTVWIASHTCERKFDLEDARLVANLSQFAAAAVSMLAAGEHKAALQESARDQAETQLAEMTDARHKLAAADRETGEILATLTHELRNSLAPLAMAARIIEVSGDPAVRTRAHQMMQRQISQMNRIIDDLLDTSRISSGKLRIDPREIDLGRIVREAVEAARGAIENSDQSLVLELPDVPINLQGDEIRLAQAIGNLLTNAAKYGVAGGTVRVALRREGAEALLSIKDSGIGIEPRMLARIFDLFVQVDGSISRAKGGLGIGLALVQRLIELHGGSVEAHSEGLGHGSEFVVRLPMPSAQTPTRVQ